MKERLCLYCVLIRRYLNGEEKEEEEDRSELGLKFGLSQTLALALNIKETLR